MSFVNWVWITLYALTPVVGVFAVRTYNGCKNKSLHKAFEGETLLFSIGVVLVLLTLWPLIAFGFALEPWILKFSYWRDRRRNRFHCSREHLLGSVTVERAETVATVIDPMHRVPDAPFGHLNAAWNAFLKRKRWGYRLRSFQVPGTPLDDLHAGAPHWTVPRGRMLGYAWVCFWKIKAEFIYEWD